VRTWVFGLLLLPAFCFSQISGLILDAESGQPVSFASVAWAAGQGMMAGFDGKFQLPADFGYTHIVVSCVGYDTDTIEVKSAYVQVNLIPKAIVLNTVVISHGKINLERFGAEKKYAESTFGAIEGFQVANYIPHPDISEKYHVRNLLYSVKGGISGSSETKPKNSFFRVRIYGVGTDGLPGKDMLEGNLVIIPDANNGWITVDISRYGLIMPTKGLFVAMEWIEGAPSAPWKYTNSEGKQTKSTDYGHSIRLHMPLDKKVKLWTYSKKGKKSGESMWWNYSDGMPDNWPTKGLVAGIAIEVMEL